MSKTAKTAIPDNEPERLQTLRAYQILDSAPDSHFDDLALVASSICATPVALISLVDESRVWFKSKIGVDDSEVRRDVAFCSHAIQQANVFLVNDAMRDPRFRTNPLVVSGPKFRFYAGAPLITEEGKALGTLCVLDTLPRELTEQQQEALRALSRQVMTQLELRRNLIALAESQKQYQHLVDSAHDVIYTTDERGRFTFCNPTAVSTLGYDLSELIGMHYLDLISPSHRAAAKEYYSSQLARRATNTYFEFPAIKKDGRQIWFGQHLQVLTKDDRVLGFQALARDITVQKKAEQEIAESEKRFHLIFSQNPFPTWVYDRKTLEFLEVNEAALRHYGYTRDEFLKMKVTQIRPEQEVSRLIDFVSQHEYKERTAGEWIHRKRDGALINVQVNTHRFMFEGREAALVVAEDITLRKKAKEELADALKRFRSVLDAATQVSIIATDTHGTIMVFNSGAECMLGYAAKEIIGQKTPEAFHLASEIKAHGEALSAQYGREIKGFDVFVEHSRHGGYEQREWTYVRKDGSQLTVDLAVTPLCDVHENLVGFLGIAKDVTPAKKAQEELSHAKELAESANKAKSSFLANMSHEIRTPMNGIIGMTDLLFNTPLTNDQRDYLNTIRVSGESLLMIINDILDFSKIESGKMDLEHELFDLRACIEESLDVVSQKARERGNELMYVIDANVPQRILGDVTRVRQVLVNIINNAVKFTENGEILLAVQKQSQTDNQFELLFSVKDNGIGIPKEKLESIFEAFTQADSSVTRKYGGTGLGLVICARIVDLMGGKIWVESQEGEGSKFFFTIKTTEAPNLATVYLAEKPSELIGKRVLIVDDNTTNLQVFSLQCKQWGMIPRTTVSPDEALRWIKNNNPFDVAVFDMQMPVKDGVQLAIEVRSIRERDSLPIVLLSSTDLNVDYIREHRELFAATALKPLKMSQLFSVMKSILGKPQQKVAGEPKTTKVVRTLALQYPLTILVAEDNIINQRLIQRMLQSMGYDPVIVDTGVEVLKALEQSSYDLIFMDVQMPEMDGLETTQRIIQNYGKSGRPRIIAMTAFALAGDKEKCLQAGMDDYISKPFVSDQISAILQELGERKNLKDRGTMKIELQTHEDADPGIQARLAQLEQETDSNFVKEIVGIFLDESPPSIQRLRDAARAGDAKNLELVAHKLKGGSMNLGAQHLSRLFESLEEKARKEDVSEAQSLVDEIDAEFGSVVHFLRQFVAKR